MKNRHWIAAMMVTLLTALAASAPLHAQSNAFVCFRDWSEASAIVEREKLAEVAGLSQIARSAADAQVVKTLLCKKGAAYVYRVVLKGADGRLRTETVNARRPFGHTVKRP